MYPDRGTSTGHLGLGYPASGFGPTPDTRCSVQPFGGVARSKSAESTRVGLAAPPRATSSTGATIAASSAPSTSSSAPSPAPAGTAPPTPAAAAPPWATDAAFGRECRSNSAWVLSTLAGRASPLATPQAVGCAGRSRSRRILATKADAILSPDDEERAVLRLLDVIPGPSGDSGPPILVGTQASSGLDPPSLATAVICGSGQRCKAPRIAIHVSNACLPRSGSRTCIRAAICSCQGGCLQRRYGHHPSTR